MHGAGPPELTRSQHSNADHVQPEIAIRKSPRPTAAAAQRASAPPTRGIGRVKAFTDEGVNELKNLLEMHRETPTYSRKSPLPASHAGRLLTP